MFAIIGATGKVGRSTIGALLRRGLEVQAVVRDAARAEDLARAGCQIAVADLAQPAALRAALDGARAVQVICPINVRASEAFPEMLATVEAVARALAAVRPAAVLAISDYGAEHAAGTGVTRLFHHLEAALAGVSPSLTFLRSAEQMENWSRHLKYARETGILPSMHHPLTKLYPTVSAGDVGDLAAELLLEAGPTARPRIVHVEGPRRYTPQDVAATLAPLLGRAVNARELPRAEWMTALQRGGLGESYARLVVELYDAHNAGRIGVEDGVGEVRRGKRELAAALAALTGS